MHSFAIATSTVVLVKRAVPHSIMGRLAASMHPSVSFTIAMMLLMRALLTHTEWVQDSLNGVCM